MAIATILEGYCIRCASDVPIAPDGSCAACGRATTIPPSYGRKGQRLIDGRWEPPYDRRSPHLTPSKSAGPKVAPPVVPRPETRAEAYARDGCVGCATKERKHHSKGLCFRCWEQGRPRSTRPAIPRPPVIRAIKEPKPRAPKKRKAIVTVAPAACPICAETFSPRVYAGGRVQTYCSQSCQRRAAQVARTTLRSLRWGPKEDACRACGRTDRPYFGQGRDRNCYMAWYRGKDRGKEQVAS